MTPRAALTFLGALALSATTLVAVQALSQDADSQAADSNPGTYQERTYTLEWVSEAPVVVECWSGPSAVVVHDFPAIDLPSGSVLKGSVFTDANVSYSDLSSVASFYTTHLSIQAAIDSAGGLMVLSGRGTNVAPASSPPHLEFSDYGRGTGHFTKAQRLEPKVLFDCDYYQGDVVEPPIGGWPSQLPVTIAAGSTATFEITVGFTTPIPAPGDADCNGTIGVGDTLAVRRILAELDEPCYELDP